MMTHAVGEDWENLRLGSLLIAILAWGHKLRPLQQITYTIVAFGSKLPGVFGRAFVLDNANDDSGAGWA